MSGHAIFRPSSRRLTRRAALATFAFVGAGALVACSSGGTAAPSGAPGLSSNAATVTGSDDSKFTPATVTISKGGTVTWTNSSTTMQHSVTADPVKAVNKADVQLPSGVQPWDSGLIAPGGTYSHTFDVSGTYKYFCIPHESLGMVGTVVVQ